MERAQLDDAGRGPRLASEAAEEAVMYPFPIIALIRQAEGRGRNIY